MCRHSCLTLLIPLGLSMALGAIARADADIALLTMGRVTYPKGSWTADYSGMVRMTNIHDPSEDTVQHNLDLETGWTDRLSLGVGVTTDEQSRNNYSLDRAVGEGRYRILDGPLQLASFVEFMPSIKRETPRGEIGLEALRNWGAIAFRIPLEMGLTKEAGRSWDLESQVGADMYYRFGLNGLAGLQWQYDSEGAHTAHAILGGRVARALFLSLEPQVGLNGKAPDFSLLFQLDFYFGPYLASGLD